MLAIPVNLVVQLPKFLEPILEAVVVLQTVNVPQIIVTLIMYVNHLVLTYKDQVHLMMGVSAIPHQIVNQTIATQTIADQTVTFQERLKDSFQMNVSVLQIQNASQASVYCILVSQIVLLR